MERNLEYTDYRTNNRERYHKWKKEASQMGKKQKADYQHLAREIIENVGGKENVISLRHCVTRVRFRLKEEGKADDQKIKSLDGVITVVKGGGEYMVVIGNKVADVYDAICVQLGMPTGESQGTSAGTTKQGRLMPLTPARFCRQSS